jgi:4-amino-4-deoxy-L-arabinose transferase-like glycosyltransferase
MIPSSRITFHASRFTLLVLTLAAFALRLWQLDTVPPGWRDDELIESLVISQKVLDGDLAVYYADASGHEALYHILNAIFLGLFGPNVPGIRWLSVISGALAVPLTYLLGRRMFSHWAGLVAAAALTLSFWSLMYSRFGIRHILLPPLALAAFTFFWRGLVAKDLGLKTRAERSRSINDWRFNHQSSITNYLLAAIFTALGFYTYFAGRGVPLILLAFMAYVWLVDRERFRRHWRGWAVMLGMMALLAVPLLVTLSRQPESETRVAEVAMPLVEARAGNFEPLLSHVRITLSMFHSTGDDEWLYNIPNRPIFGPIGAIFFWSGVAVAFWYALQPIVSRITYHVSRVRQTEPQAATRFSLASAFLLLWWLAGISPGFISVPPASLGHTILAQPAVYLLAALPVWRLGTGDWRLLKQHLPVSSLQSPVSGLLGLVLLFSIATRDLSDYFVKWPERGMVRFLYRADIQDVARYLNAHPMTDVGVSGLLAGPWDKLALEIDLDDDVETPALRADAASAVEVAVRWFNPERAILLQPPVSFTGYPVAAAYADWLEPVGDVHAGGYSLSRVTKDLELAEPVCFVNGLCWVTAVYHPKTQILELGWQVGRELDLPDMPLISNPPPPGVYAGPRLYVFGQLWDIGGNFLTGDDGLWVDPATLQPGDLFIQQHHVQLAEGVVAETAVFGLYDPMTGERILTEDGREYLRLEIND